MRRRIIIAALCLLATYSTTAAAAERFALVIGNGAYEHIEPLTNPPRDAELIAESLENVGFAVTLIVEASRRQMDESTKQFACTFGRFGEKYGSHSALVARIDLS